MGKRGPKPKKQVDTHWRSELAYAVGLIATDGCLSKDGRHIDLTSKDLDQLETFRKCLGLSVRVGYKGGRSHNKRYGRIQFGDVNFYQFLLRLGLTPKKSKTLGALKIPQHYFFHFLRGCFDGDGHVYSYFDPRWRNSFIFYVGFTSASDTHLRWLQRKLGQLLGVRGRFSRSVNNSATTLRFAKREGAKILQAIYRDKSDYFLKRKYDKVKKILEINAQVAELVYAAG